MAHLDSEEVIARILLTNGKDKTEPLEVVYEGEVHEIPPGHMNGLNLDVGDHIEVKYVSETRIEFVSHANGADEDS